MAYLQFALPAAGAPITSAILTLNGAETANPSDEPAVKLNAYAVANSGWGEGTINFSNAPAVNTSAPIGSVTVSGTSRRATPWT